MRQRLYHNREKKGDLTLNLEQFNFNYAVREEIRIA